MSEQNQHGTQMISLGTKTLTCDKSIPPRPILPEQNRYPIFIQCHNLCHSNWKSTSLMILARSTLPNAQRTIKEWCHNYLTCQQMKITRHVHPPTRQVNEAVARFTHVRMDIVGPLPAIKFRHSDTLLASSTAAQIGLKPTQYIPSLPKKFATLFKYPGFLASEYPCTSRPTAEPNLKVNFSPNFLKL